LEATGHAGLDIKGNDILCAATTVLLRTTTKLIFANKKIQSAGSKENPGSLMFEVMAYKQEETEWMRGVSDFFTTGLEDLNREYPDRIVIRNSKE